MGDVEGAHGLTVRTQHGVILVVTEGHLVVKGAQFAGVFDRDVQVAGAGTVIRAANTALANGKYAVDVIEQRGAELPVGVQALPQLGVDGLADHHGGTPQVVDGRHQHVLAITQQAADGATADHRADVHGLPAGGQHHRVLALVVLARHRRQLVRHTVRDQGLPGTQGDIEMAVRLSDLDPYQFVERTHRFVACIQQVRRLAVALAFGLEDLLVEGGNRGGQLIDLAGDGLQLAVDAFFLFVQFGRNRVEAVAQSLGNGQDQLARGVVAGVGRRRLQRGEEAVQGRTDTGGLVGQQLVHRTDLVQVGLGIKIQRRGGLQLGIEELVIHPAYIRQRSAGADEHPTGRGHAIGGLHGLLTRVSRGLGVGNVVTQGRKRSLSRIES